MRSLLILVILVLQLQAYGQNHDYHWAFGYGYTLPSDTNSTVGTCLVDFNSGYPEIVKKNLGLRFDSHTAVCSDSSGQLQFYTNGLRIFNKQFQPMANGDTINPGQQWQNAVEDSAGYISFAPLVLPDPAGGNRYYLIHTGIYLNNGVKFGPLYFTSIDMQANNGNGRVVKKNQILAQGDFSEATATKHANGRDWWIIVNVADQPRFLRYLVTPEGITAADEQVTTGLDFAIPSGANRARMSPDGQYYAFISGNNFTVLYDFDRCSGLLSNQRILYHVPGFYFSYLSFSPDSRFLYLNLPRSVSQYDLWADTLSGTLLDTVQQYDLNAYPFQPFQANFAEASIGPDHKLYYTPGTSTRFLNPMHRPGLPGSACDLENSGLFLPRYISYTYYHNPDYRLGALAGSPCDTLFFKNTQNNGHFRAGSYEQFLEQQNRSARQSFRQPVSGKKDSIPLPYNPGTLKETVANRWNRQLLKVPKNPSKSPE